MVDSHYQREVWRPEEEPRGSFESRETVRSTKDARRGGQLRFLRNDSCGRAVDPNSNFTREASGGRDL